MVLEGGKFKKFSALRAEVKRRSAPGILPPPRKNPGYAPARSLILLWVEVIGINEGKHYRP